MQSACRVAPLDATKYNSQHYCHCTLPLQKSSKHMANMATQFNDLPTEIQLRIFDIAIAADFQPRIVRVYRTNKGNIYSKTTPPPLLRVCQLSRYAVLKLHKPWLPQFKGTKGYKLYERLARRKGANLLENVCVSMEHDLLVLDHPLDLAPITFQTLRRLAVSLHGYLPFGTYASVLSKFKGLRTLTFYDNDDKNQTLGFKGSSIDSKLIRYGTKVRKCSDYDKPQIKYDRKFKSTTTSWKWGINRWITYKYPKGYRHTSASQPKSSRRRRAEISTCNGWTLKSQNKRTRGEEDMEQGQLPKRRKLSSNEKQSVPRLAGRKSNASSFHSLMSSSSQRLPKDHWLHPPSSEQGLPQAFSGFDTNLTVMPMRRATRSSLHGPILDAAASSEQAETAEEGKSPGEDQDSLASASTDSEMEIDEEESESDEPVSAEPDQAEEEEDGYVPEKIHSERETANGMEFLVQWEDYPNEEDWTWEPEETMVEDVPDLVISWQLARDELKVVTEEPEKILGKRKFRGVDHYLVKWKGYDKVKDRTWEPCERFSLDAPVLVEDYEAKMEKRK